MIEAHETTNNDPVDMVIDVLRKAGHESFHHKNAWESCLCALVMALEPRCKTYRLLEALPYRDRHLDRVDVLNTIAGLGYFSRSVQIDIKYIDTRLLPCLFITADSVPSVILDKTEHAIKLFNNGKIKTISLDKLPSIKGTTWIFEPYDENRSSTSKFMRTGSGYNWFRALLGRFHGTIGQIMISGFFLNMIALTTPLFIMIVYDRVIAAGTLEILPMLTVGVGISIVFEWILRSNRSRGLSWLAGRMDNIVGNKIFSHLTGLSPDLIESASVAAQIARIKTFESVRDFFSGSVFLSALEMPFVALAAIAIFSIAGPLIFVPLSMVGVYCFLFYVVHKKVKTVIRLAAKASSARQQFTIETFEKIQGLRAYGLSKLWQSKFRDLSGREMLTHFHLNWLGMLAETLAHSLTIISAVATVGFGVHLIWAGSMSTGALVATMILVWRILMPFYSLCTMIPRLEQLRNSIMQVNKLMDINTEAMDAVSAARLPKIHGRITFSNVSLRYSQDSDFVFSNLNFNTRAGDLLVISGDNGSGKTSILKLIKSMHQAESGSVQLDGFDIRQLDAPDLRRQIAYVPQQPDFFHGTVLENLRLANPLASYEDIEKAMHLADVWNDIAALPKGFETVIGRYGACSLPSSLATRLSLARAYLHPAPVLLIDELPNALLSSVAGKNLKDYLVANKGKRTCIMVTYREDFMKLADAIVLLQRGQHIKSGTRDEILNTSEKNREAA